MGTVHEVCVKDADPVEFGTVLFYIEPHSVQPVSGINMFKKVLHRKPRRGGPARHARLQRNWA